MSAFLVKYWWLVAVVIYVVVGVGLGIYLNNTGAERPILGGLLWPIRLFKMWHGG
jgi:uncharacterized membrane protein